MTTQISRTTIFTFVFVAFLTAPSAGASDVIPLRVGLEQVPGVEDIIAGDIGEGIETLELALEDKRFNRGYLLATLCGAYILNSSLEEAEKVCNDAVEKFPSETAFNNRGVLRARTGDFKRAMEDFNRARPRNLDEYLKKLKIMDVGLIANRNHDLLKSLTATHSRPIRMQRSE